MQEKAESEMPNCVITVLKNSVENNSNIQT